jgi:hypothetical protein
MERQQAVAIHDPWIAATCGLAMLYNFILHVNIGYVVVR